MQPSLEPAVDAASPFRMAVLFPCKNDGATVVECVRRALRVLGDEAEYWIIDGSAEASATLAIAELVEAHSNVHYLSNRPDLGKGHAIAVGVAHCRAPLVAQIDADLQFFPEELPKLWEPLFEDRADLVLGSRFHRESTRLDGAVPWHRHLGNLAVSSYVSMLCGHRFCDVLTGMKAWRRQMFEALAPLSLDFNYDLELPYLARARGFRVEEVPITTDRRRQGRSAVNVVPAGISMLNRATRLRLRRSGNA
jgi:dolichol-phosphate mannosyltransferase